MVAQALELQAAHEAARPRLEVDDPQRFGQEWRRFLTERAGPAVSATDRSSCSAPAARRARPTPRAPRSPRSTSRSRACPAPISRACRSCARRRGASAGARATTSCSPPTTTGPVEPWLAAAARELAPALAHCAFWPGAEDPAAVVRWARGTRAAGRLLGRRLAARQRRGGRRRARAARARRGARRPDDGPRRRGAAGGLEGVVIDGRRPAGRDRARLRAALRLRPPPLRPRARAAGGAGLPGRAGRPRDDRGGMGRSTPPPRSTSRCRSAPSPRSSCRLDPRRLPGGGPRRHGARAPSGLGDDPALGRRPARARGPASSCTPRAPRRSRPRRGAGSASSARGTAASSSPTCRRPALLGEQREHFGFTDGFSQPAIEGVAREDIPGQGIPYRRAPWWPLSRTRWRAVKPGEFVLGYEDEDGGPPPAPPAPFDRNATFMVWRKLHQDVAGFRAQLAEQAERLRLDEELVAAKLVGRWRDGSPLALRPRRPRPGAGQRQGARQRLPLRRRRSSGCAARAARTCGARTRATRSAGRAG